MRYLLDTNVWIKIMKARDFQLIDRFTRTLSSEIVVCSVVRAELMYGAHKYEDFHLRRIKVETALQRMISLPFDDRCADAYARIRHDLELRRCVIGPYDLQIAAIAMANDLTIVTGNTEEFCRVHGLKVEDWSV